MIDLAEHAPPDALIALVILGVMFALFITERWPADVIALAGVAAMLGLGVLPYEEALRALSNPAPWTIAAMFVIAGSIARTGVLDRFTRFAEAQTETSPGRGLALLIGFTVFASAFVNNTPVVLIMIPVFVQLANRLGISASKLLIPLSYASILGGTLTLLGTSTNLLVAGVAQTHGLRPFTIFEITPLAAVLVVWGMIYLHVFVPRLLPDRTSMAALLANRGKKKFFAEVAIPEHSPLIGMKPSEVRLFRREGVRLIDILRGEISLRHDLAAVTLRAGDHVILRTQMEELLGLQDDPDLGMVDKVSSHKSATVEVLITPGTSLQSQTLGQLKLPRRYGVYPLAVHRRNRNIRGRLDQLVLKVGDTLLIEGPPESIAHLADNVGAIDISRPTARAYRRAHAPFAIAALLGIVILAALGVAPILFLAILAVALVLLLRCIDADEAYSFVDGRLLVLIFSMLAIGTGLETSGAVSMIVTAVVPHLQTLPPFMIVWAVYLLTSVLTELVSNNAVSVVVTPLAISLGVALGVDPRPLVIAVMIAASASFATPIGYQTNMMVYGPGGYRFTDFLRAGIPLNLSVGLLASALIPIMWPLQAVE